jgi:tetratricopeptide (TPR) repeat protein
MVHILTCSGTGILEMIKRTFALMLLLGGVLSPAQANQAAFNRQQSVAAIMAAEYALQNNDLKTAALEYVKAARHSDDLALSERASRLAISADMPELARQALNRWRALSPSSSVMLALALSFEMRQGEAEAAYRDSRLLLAAASPEHDKALIDTLRAQKSDGGVMARAVMREIAVNANEVLPEQATLWIRLWVLSDQIAEAGAQRILAEKMGAKFTQDARAQVIFAASLREKNQLMEALMATLNATKLTPQTPWVKQNILKELTQLQAWPEADAYLAAMPQTESTLLQRGRFVIANNQPELTEKFYLQLSQNELANAARASAKILLLQAQLADHLGRWSEAEALYPRVLEGPEQNQAQLRLPVMLQNQNRLVEALAMLHGYQKNPDADGEFVRDSYLVEANLFPDITLDKKAMNVFLRGLAIFENDPLLLYARAMQHEKMGRAKLALADLDLVLAHNAQNAEALNAYGYILAKHKKDYVQAMVYLEKAMKLKPNASQIMASYGWVKLKLGQKQESLNWLEKAWLRAKVPEVAAHLGEAYWALGRKEDAKKVWTQGQAINPRHSVWAALKKNYSP